MVLVARFMPCPVRMGVVDAGDLGAREPFTYDEGLHGCGQVATVVAPPDGCQRVHCVIHPCWTNLLNLDVDSEVSGR